MTLIPTQSLPILGNPSSTEDPNLLATLNTIVSAINGGLDAANAVGMTRATPSGLRVLRGRVTAAGAVAGGAGFTVARTALGRYTITFTTAFSVTPTLVVASDDVGYVYPTVYPTSTTACSVTYTDTDNSFGYTYIDTAFFFMCVGPG